MNQEPQTEPPRKTLAQAILEAQKNIGAAKKGTKNPFYGSTFASLGSVMEACKDACNDAGITILQPVQSDDHGEYVETILLHDATGERLTSRMRIHPPMRMVWPPKPKDAPEGWEMPFKPYLAPDPQAQGSAISYARRYALQSMLFIPAEDDDGEKGMQRGGKTKNDDWD